MKIDDNDEKLDSEQIPVETLLGFHPEEGKTDDFEESRSRYSIHDEIRSEAHKIFEILQQDGPGYNARQVLDEMQLQVSNVLVREVLFRILVSINYSNKPRCAKMAYKFFLWSADQSNYSHNTTIYNLTMKIFAQSEELKAMWRLLEEMLKKGLPVTARTFNSLMDGLSRAGNLEACKYFYDEMVKMGCEPDVVCYTVLITSYVLAEQFEDAHEVFDQMLTKGHLPNVYTYNSIIKGLCGMGRFQEACDMLKEMDSRGCLPNFSVYCHLVRRLRHAGKMDEATDVVNFMVEK